jgi:hypothetical protein
MGMNPFSAGDQYCQLYPAQERKVMNLAQTTQFFKKQSSEKGRDYHPLLLIGVIKIQSDKN